MLYAIGPDGSKAVAVKGLQGTCPGCRLVLIPKCGSIKCHHWSHRSGDCDPWYEPESAWHVGWKNLASSDRVEVVIGPHRADIISRGGVVVELQHSSISVEEAIGREEFYCDMIWLFDAQPFASRLKWINPGSPGRPHVSFIWKHRRPTLWELTAPIFWDLGDPGRLLEVKGLWNASGGSGRWVSRPEFVRQYIA